MKVVAYSKVRDLICVGDGIGCRSNHWFGKAIRFFKGGVDDLSHFAPVIRDTQNEATGRVEVLEALTKEGMQRNYLSKLYEVDHGKLFWLKATCTLKQREQIMEIGAQIVEKDLTYDFKSTLFAIFTPIFMDAKKFNCSEWYWYLLTRVKRVLKRYDKKGREVAPVPGDLPTWVGVELYELDMHK